MGELHEFKIKIGGKTDVKMVFDPYSRHGQYFLRYFNEGLCYEPEMTHVMVRALRPGDVAIDVGACMGFFTVLMAKLVGPEGRVIAVDPVRENCERVCTNCDENGVLAAIVNFPLWRKEEKITFYNNADDFSAGAVWDVGTWKDNPLSKEHPDPVEKMSTTLDALVQPPVRLIKIDTEGAEQAIMEGGQKLLVSHPPYILSELNPNGLAQLGYSIETYRAFMRSWGYEMFCLHDSGIFPSWIPEKIQVKSDENCYICNVLFSTMEDVCHLWAEI